MFDGIWRDIVIWYSIFMLLIGFVVGLLLGGMLG